MFKKSQFYRIISYNAVDDMDDIASAHDQIE